MAATKSKQRAKRRPADAVPPPPDRKGSLQTAIASLILVAATVVAYGHVVREDFVHWDDIVHVFENPHFARFTPDNLEFFWKHPYEHLYIPVSYMAFALIAWLSRMPHIDHTVTSVETLFNPHYFHTANLILHTANALIVFAILLRLTRTALPVSPGEPETRHIWASLVGALLFSLHPLQVESVAWISELRGLLSGFFSLAAIYAYLLAIGTGDDSFAPLGRASYWAALLLTVLAMLAKPSTVSLPLVLFAIDRWIVGRPLRASALSAAPWLLISLAFVVITHFVQEVSPSDVAAIWKRPFIAGDALAFYLGKLVNPTNLTIDYGRRPAVVMAHTWGYLTWLAPAAVAAVIFVFRRRRPWLVAAGVIAIANLLPVLGLMPFAFQSFSTVADRYVYLAMLGPAVVVAMLLANASLERRLIAYAASAAALAVLAVMTVLQVRHWNDSVTLFRWAVRLNPNSYGVHENYGVSLDDSAAVIDGDGTAAIARRRAIYTEAIGQYTETISLKPDDATAYNDRGVAEIALGGLSGAAGNAADVAAAIADYREAITLDPTIYLAHRGLAVALMQQNDMDGALDESAEAVRLAEGDSRTHTIYAMILHRVGDDDQAAAEYQRAIDLQPGLFEAMAGLGDVYLAMKRPADAITEYRASIAVQPDDAGIHFSLARALFNNQQVADAVTELETCVRLKPLPLYYDRLGIANAVTGNLPAARQAFETELSLDPSSNMARSHLAKLAREQQSLSIK